MKLRTMILKYLNNSFIWLKKILFIIVKNYIILWFKE